MNLRKWWSDWWTAPDPNWSVMPPIDQWISYVLRMFVTGAIAVAVVVVLVWLL